jgi:hypothetical protein
VQHGADHRHGIVQLEMPVRVPGEAGDAVAGLDAELHQRVRKLRHPLGKADVIVAEERALIAARDDLAPGVIANGVFENPADRQRYVHHRSADRSGRVEARVGGLHEFASFSRGRYAAR